MALPYRPIRAAPVKEGTALPRTLIERAASKRSGIIKSACWECRKRKAKCNGQKPVCVNCSKYDRECVYDSDIRESRVRGLQKANEKLEEELQAAKLLLRQMANGSAHLRDVVSGLLEDDKQPTEIKQLLENGERTNLEIGDADNGRLSTTLNDTTLGRVASGTPGIGDPCSFAVEESGSLNAEIPIMQQEESSSDGDSYIIMEAETSAVSTAGSSILSASNYSSTELSPEHAQINTPSFIDSSNDTLFYSSQISYSQSSMPSARKAPIKQLPVSNQQDYREDVLTDTTKSRSLFFQPLFNHNDYFLTTSITTPMPQDIGSTNLSVSNEYFEIPENITTNVQDGIPNSYLSTKPSSPVYATKEELQDTALRIHPNYKNHFGNLALSNSIRANGYPRHIQDAQIRNIFVPNWAATTLNTELDPGDMSNAFSDIYQKATSLLKKGEPVNRVIGDHPNIAALYDQEQFDRSSLLSQWAARMVHSVKCQGYDFTCFASMNVFWYMMRWMIDPSPETYAAMPEWIRPTANQLFTPHISMADFVLWPAFRELVVQFPQLQERMAWLADMSMHIRCEWPYALEDALKPDPINGTVDLVNLAKEHVGNLGCWSVGPSFRKLVMNADAYLQIRNEE